MATIDMNSILTKAKKTTGTASFQKKIEEKVDTALMTGSVIGNGGGKNAKIYGTSMAAAKFIEVLQNEIRSHAASEGGGGFSAGGLGSTAIDALIKLDHGEPVKVGKNRYQIGVWFTEDLSRESLAPDKYEGVENIAALLNTGYTAGHRVYGIWKGHGDERRTSLVERDGARFIENAIRDYMSNYANDYGVIDIEVDEVYK